MSVDEILNDVDFFLSEVELKASKVPSFSDGIVDIANDEEERKGAPAGNQSAATELEDTPSQLLSDVESFVNKLSEGTGKTPPPQSRPASGPNDWRSRYQERFGKTFEKDNDGKTANDQGDERNSSATSDATTKRDSSFGDHFVRQGTGRAFWLDATKVENTADDESEKADGVSKDAPKHADVENVKTSSPVNVTSSNNIDEAHSGIDNSHPVESVSKVDEIVDRDENNNNEYDSNEDASDGENATESVPEVAASSGIQDGYENNNNEYYSTEDASDGENATESVPEFAASSGTQDGYDSNSDEHYSAEDASESENATESVPEVAASSGIQVGYDSNSDEHYSAEDASDGENATESAPDATPSSTIQDEYGNNDEHYLAEDASESGIASESVPQVAASGETKNEADMYPDIYEENAKTVFSEDENESTPPSEPAPSQSDDDDNTDPSNSGDEAKNNIRDPEESKSLDHNDENAAGERKAFANDYIDNLISETLIKMPAADVVAPNATTAGTFTHIDEHALVADIRPEIGDMESQSSHEPGSPTHSSAGVESAEDARLAIVSAMKKAVGVKHSSLHNAFWAMDANKSGSLSPAQLRRGIRRLSLEVSDNHLDVFVSSVDANKDGAITFQEFWDAFNESHINASRVQWRPRPRPRIGFVTPPARRSPPLPDLKADIAQTDPLPPRNDFTANRDYLFGEERLDFDRSEESENDEEGDVEENSDAAESTFHLKPLPVSASIPRMTSSEEEESSALFELRGRGVAFLNPLPSPSLKESSEGDSDSVKGASQNTSARDVNRSDSGGDVSRKLESETIRDIVPTSKQLPESGPEESAQVESLPAKESSKALTIQVSPSGSIRIDMAPHSTRPVPVPSPVESSAPATFAERNQIGSSANVASQRTPETPLGGTGSAETAIAGNVGALFPQASPVLNQLSPGERQNSQSQPFKTYDDPSASAFYRASAPNIPRSPLTPFRSETSAHNFEQLESSQPRPQGLLASENRRRPHQSLQPSAAEVEAQPQQRISSMEKTQSTLLPSDTKNAKRIISVLSNIEDHALRTQLLLFFLGPGDGEADDIISSAAAMHPGSKSSSKAIGEFLQEIEVEQIRLVFSAQDANSDGFLEYPTQVISAIRLCVHVASCIGLEKLAEEWRGVEKDGFWSAVETREPRYVSLDQFISYFEHRRALSDTLGVLDDAPQRQENTVDKTVQTSRPKEMRVVSQPLFSTTTPPSTCSVVCALLSQPDSSDGRGKMNACVNSSGKLVVTLPSSAAYELTFDEVLACGGESGAKNLLMRIENDVERAARAIVEAPAQPRVDAVFVSVGSIADFIVDVAVSCLKNHDGVTRVGSSCVPCSGHESARAHHVHCVNFEMPGQQARGLRVLQLGHTSDAASEANSYLTEAIVQMELELAQLGLRRRDTVSLGEAILAESVGVAAGPQSDTYAALLPLFKSCSLFCYFVADIANVDSMLWPVKCASSIARVPLAGVDSFRVEDDRVERKVVAAEPTAPDLLHSSDAESTPDEPSKQRPQYQPPRRVARNTPQESI